MNILSGPHPITIFFGCMGTSKSFEIISRLKAAAYDHGQRVIAFKPYFPNDDQSYEKARWIYSREQDLKFPSIPIQADNPKSIYDSLEFHLKENKIKDIKLIGYDELQFFSKEILDVLLDFSKITEQVGAGLNTTYTNEPFGSMPQIISIADTAKQTKGFCSVSECGERSVKTFRDPSAGKEIIQEGSIEEDIYFPMCKQHYFTAIKNGIQKLKIKKISRR